MQNNNLILNSINSLEEIVENSENYTLIEIDSKIYAIKTKNVLEIIKVIDMDYSHQMPTYVLGLIEFESAPIGVIDLREIFKKERITYDLSAKIIVIKARDCITSIICDKVYDIKKLPTRKIQQVPYQQETNYFDGLYNDNQESAYILNIDNIINYVRKNPNQFMPSDNEIKYLVSDEESKEILNHRIKNQYKQFNSSFANCKLTFNCNKAGSKQCKNSCPSFKEKYCPNLTKAPYVCNACDKKKICRLSKYYYRTKDANTKYKDLRTNSRIVILF